MGLKMTAKTFPKIDVYSTGGDFVTPHGETKFLKGSGRKKDRNIDTWEDKRQNRLIKEWLESRKKNKKK
jgi:hypothetical protein